MSSRLAQQSRLLVRLATREIRGYNHFVNQFTSRAGAAMDVASLVALGAQAQFCLCYTAPSVQPGGRHAAGTTRATQSAGPAGAGVWRVSCGSMARGGVGHRIWLRRGGVTPGRRALRAAARPALRHGASALSDWAGGRIHLQCLSHVRHLPGASAAAEPARWRRVNRDGH